MDLVMTSRSGLRFGKLKVCFDRREIVLGKRKRLRDSKNNCGVLVRGRDPKAVASCLERIQELRSARC